MESRGEKKRKVRGEEVIRKKTELRAERNHSPELRSDEKSDWSNVRRRRRRKIT